MGSPKVAGLNFISSLTSEVFTEVNVNQAVIFCQLTFDLSIYLKLVDDVETMLFKKSHHVVEFQNYVLQTALKCDFICEADCFSVIELILDLFENPLRI